MFICGISSIRQSNRTLSIEEESREQDHPARERAFSAELKIAASALSAAAAAAAVHHHLFDLFLVQMPMNRKLSSPFLQR